MTELYVRREDFLTLPVDVVFGLSLDLTNMWDPEAGTIAATEVGGIFYMLVTDEVYAEIKLEDRYVEHT